MRAIAWTIARLPWRFLRSLGAVLGLVAGSLLRIRRRQVEDALLTAGLPSSLAPGVYASLGAGVFELLWLAGRPAGEALPFSFSPEASSALLGAAAAGRGVVVATAHTGNWDLTACGAAAWLGASEAGSLTVVTKRLSWRGLDRYWQRLRAERGVMLVDAAGAVSSVQAALRAGGVVALLVDQAPTRTSGVVTASFLGRPAKHDLAPALLAAKARAPLLVMAGWRTADGEHRLELLASIGPEELRGGRRAAERATARIAAAVEGFVREHPEQWLWLHRRWK
jgi:Kdo2-lipid IVA lauroyltransferase/acyltransferase